MLIGVPSEIKHNEERVALTPEAVGTLKGDGHRVVVERDAGNGSGLSNEDYERAGAEIVDGHARARECAGGVLRDTVFSSR